MQERSEDDLFLGNGCRDRFISDESIISAQNSWEAIPHDDSPRETFADVNHFDHPLGLADGPFLKTGILPLNLHFGELDPAQFIVRPLC